MDRGALKLAEMFKTGHIMVIFCRKNGGFRHSAVFLFEADLFITAEMLVLMNIVCMEGGYCYIGLVNS